MSPCLKPPDAFYAYKTAQCPCLGQAHTTEKYWSVIPCLYPASATAAKPTGGRTIVAFAYGRIGVAFPYGRRMPARSFPPLSDAGIKPLLRSTTVTGNVRLFYFPGAAPLCPGKGVRHS
jgi:hypothetical protein